MIQLCYSGLEYERLEKDTNLIKTLDPDLKAKIHKNIKEVDRLVTIFEKGKGTSTAATSMDRLMTEIRKTSVKVQHEEPSCNFTAAVVENIICIKFNVNFR